MTVVDLATKLASFTDVWTPKIIGMVDDYHVYVAKLEGDFVWHAHDTGDELFLVLEGELEMYFRDRTERAGPGQMLIVPKDVEHKPQSAGCSVLIMEKANTDHSGGVDTPLRQEHHERI